MLLDDISALASWSRRHPDAFADLRSSVLAVRAGFKAAPDQARQLFNFLRQVVRMRVAASGPPVVANVARPAPESVGIGKMGDRGKSKPKVA